MKEKLSVGSVVIVVVGAAAVAVGGAVVADVDAGEGGEACTGGAECVVCEGGEGSTWAGKSAGSTVGATGVAVTAAVALEGVGGG